MTTPRRLIAALSALVLLPVLAATVSPPAGAAGDGDLFTPVPGFRPAPGDAARVRPTAYRAYRADLGAIRTALAGGGARTIVVPAPTGELPEFTVVEDSVMAPALQADHPELRTYAGHGPAGSTIRLDVTPMGFHAMVRNPDGVSWYVDPARTRVGEATVLSYLGAAVPEREQAFVEQGLERTAERLSGGDQVAPNPGGIVSRRTYRLAFITDKSYADQFGGGSDAAVFAEKTTLVNRVNEVYNDDLAIKFEMVPGTDTKLNFNTTAEETGAGGPCGATACYTTAQLAGCDGPLLDRNEFVLGMLIGAENFDIGHIGLGKNGGGIAGLGVVGGPYKADGCTGIGAPTTGDVYAIDYVAHEMGHQMGGDHTFNGTQVNCSPGNRNDVPYTTQVEPGSGSSIMAYAGICGTDDLQPHSDPYFSFASVDQVNATTGATPTNEDERQVVAFKGLAADETFTLSCSGCSTSSPIGITGNPVGDRGAIAAAVTAVTGVTVIPTQVSGYYGTGDDPLSNPSLNGFTVDFDTFGAGAGTDIKTLTVQQATGTFEALVGTVYNGGPTTNGGTLAATANSSPVVTAPAAKTIPVRTPFTLTGSATDPDSDPLTYMWEQTDPGGVSGTGLVSNTKVDGPLFRQFGTAALVTEPDSEIYDSPGENLADGNPSRTFPDLAQILAGNTNAATGSCPVAGADPVDQAVVDCYSEFLPTSAWLGNPLSPRMMHFRLTARDRFTGTAAPGTVTPGGLSSADTTLTVDPAAGPFLVTSRATAGAPASGFEPVTWSVAGTNTAAMAPNVKISLSTDGGLTFPTVLAASTPNDGSEVVSLPGAADTDTARIKIEAVGNYFFDINDADFSIEPTGGNATPFVDAGPDKTVALGNAFTSTGSFADESPATATATVDYGDGAGPQPLALSGSTFTLNHAYTSPGVRTVTVRVSDGAKTGVDTVTVTTTGKRASAVAAKAKPKKVTKGRGFKAKVTVTAAGGFPSGVVEVYKGTKLLGTGTLGPNGKVKVKITKKKAKKLALGKNTLTASYLGSATVAAGQVDFVVKVKPKRS